MMSTNESLIALKSILIGVEWIFVFVFPGSYGPPNLT